MANLNIKKVVDGATADPEQEFEFTINVVQKDENGEAIESVDTENYNDYLWFSILDKDGNKVFLDEVPNGWVQSGTNNYYYAPNGTELIVPLRNGDNLRFTNLISNTDFDVKENTVYRTETKGAHIDNEKSVWNGMKVNIKLSKNDIFFLGDRRNFRRGAEPA